MITVLQLIGILVTPVALISIGFLYLFLAFGTEDYENKRGEEYYCKLHPGEYAPHDARFWYWLELEEGRKNKK